jgi:hypothetical protein
LDHFCRVDPQKKIVLNNEDDGTPYAYTIH